MIAILARIALCYPVDAILLGAVMIFAAYLRDQHVRRKAARKRHPSARLTDEQVFATFADIALYFDLSTADEPEPRSKP